MNTARPDHVASDQMAVALTAETGVAVRSVLGARCTTFAIGGEIRRLIEPETPEQLSAALRWIHSAGGEVRMLGAGSNLLIDDLGVGDAWVVRLGRGFRSVEPLAEGIFKVGGAVSLMNLARTLSDGGFAGLEFAGGIPASIGGALRMNAGAHGGELGERVRSVTFFDRFGHQQTLTRAELTFSYRHSSIPNGTAIVAVELELLPSDRERTAALRAHHLAERKARQPLSMPSAGSVFRNPAPETPAGMLLDRAGLKGVSHGGAMFSTMHANWIVNPQRTALCTDVVALIERAQQEVLHYHQVQLVPEVVRWKPQHGSVPA